MVTKDIWASLIVMLNEIKDQSVAEGISDDLQVIDWENHANEQELPNVDLIGIANFSVVEETAKMFSVPFGVGISTYGTADMFKLREIVARVFERLRVEQTITIFSADVENTILGEMVIHDGTSMLPVSRSTTRPFQLIQSEALVLPEKAIAL